jgi:multidrug efflux system outer membrane protein
MRIPFPIIVVLLAALGSGCAVGPNYQAPKIKSSPAFAELNSTVNANEPVADWWRTFHDPELDRLVREALDHNYDLQVAAMRIRESRAQRNIVAADLFPQVNADGSYVHSHGSKNVVLPLGGSGAQGTNSPAVVTPRPTALNNGNVNDNAGNSPSAPPPNPFGQGGVPGATTDLYQVGFDASWEIDVFGGQRRRVEAASADFEAASQGRRDLQVTVAAEVARDYLELRGTQERLQIARSNLVAQNDILALTRSKRSVGFVTEFDVLRAASEVDTTEAGISPLEAQLKILAHSVSILVGQEPDELTKELSAAQPIPSAPPQVPVGLPSQLLQRRADIRQAERQIAAANARIGVAQADLFPKFALIGNVGLDSSSPGDLFNWGSRYFLISPTVTWQIFDAGRVLGNIRLQHANEQEADLQYRGIILKALKEVEDALVNYATEQTRRNHLADAVKQNQDALDLARRRYDQGLADFLTVLDAERSVFSAQDAYTQSSQSISTSLVALYKSLGGGWK